MIGEKKSNWTVESHIGKSKNGQNLWLCRCDCGHSEKKSTGYLNYNKSSYCRCCRAGIRKQQEDVAVNEYLGKQVNNWRVVEFAGRNKYGSRTWLCECKCGNKRKFLTAHLSGNGKRKATACKQCELKNLELSNRIKYIPDRFWNKLLHTARRREIEVAITKSEAQKQFDEQNGLCALTRKDLYFTSLRTHYTRYTTASLDRIDSDRPYSPDNVQWVHKRINIMKGSLSQKDFIEWCDLVATNT